MIICDEYRFRDVLALVSSIMPSCHYARQVKLTINIVCLSLVPRVLSHPPY